ncbi:MAG: hypothetical protein LBC58_06475, partial [Clostridiales Family XIII bacterium]|nr:hypothetical protein [Clostridiales Family XIII bacterium]
NPKGAVPDNTVSDTNDPNKQDANGDGVAGNKKSESATDSASAQSTGGGSGVSWWIAPLIAALGIILIIVTVIAIRTKEKETP